MKRKNRKMEPSRKPGTPVPGYTPELGTRIAEAIEAAGGLRVAAGLIGVSEDSLAQWRDGKARPSFYGLRQLTQEAGKSMDWLATGVEPIRVDKSVSRPSRDIPIATDAELMALLTDAISKAYREEGGRIGAADLGRLAARYYDDLLAAYEDPQERRVGVKVMLARLRRELREPPMPAESDKRSA